MYRKIYERHYSSIPKDDECGRPYHIHHIGGNHLNNDPTNLKCVTVQEHFDIHLYKYAGDLGRETQKLVGSYSNPERRKKHSNRANQEFRDGTHNFIGLNEKLLNEGTHNILTMHTCPHCLKEIKGPIYFRHHGDNCISIRKTQ